MTAFTKKILVVDDDKLLRKTLQKMLVTLGYNVELAENAEDALEILEKRKFPLIITDLRMPDIDGTELCKRIRKINSESIIYALSGYIEKFKPEKLERIGFDGHLCKPVEIKVLKHAIEGAFDKIDQRRGKATHASALRE